MKLSAVVYSVHALINEKKMTQRDFIALCKGLQCDSVELFDLYLGEDRKQELDDLKTELQRNNMQVCCYMISNDFTRPEAFEENYAKAVQGIKDAAFLGAPMARILGGATGEMKDESRSEALTVITSALKKLVPVAEKNKVTLVLENHGDLPGSADELIQIIEAVNSPYLKVCCDIGNFIAGNMAVKYEPLAELKKLLPYLAHVHVKDRRFVPGARGDVTACAPGTGDVPLQACMDELKNNNYDGFISCEFDGDERVSAMTGFISALANIRYAIELTR